MLFSLFSLILCLLFSCDASQHTGHTCLIQFRAATLPQHDCVFSAKTFANDYESFSEIEVYQTD
jgi:hypothetical protein